jgi:predicted nucleic acid-binding Zn ribbon protein
MKLKKNYHKSCVVCNKEYTCEQASSKTCSQSCRNALSIGRKLQNIPTGVITPVITAVITPKANNQKQAGNNEIKNEQNILTTPYNNILTPEVIIGELKRQNICSDKGDIYCHLFYKYIVHIHSSAADKKKVEILPEKFKDFGFNFKKQPKKITLGEYILIQKFEDLFSVLFGLIPHYVVEKNQDIALLMAS